MEQTSIFSDTLGLFPPWYVTDVALSASENRLDITIAYDCATQVFCPGCQGVISPRAGGMETWYRRDFFQHPTYLYAQVPQLVCACGHHLSVERPWSRAGSHFERLD